MSCSGKKREEKRKQCNRRLSQQRAQIVSCLDATNTIQSHADLISKERMKSTMLGKPLVTSRCPSQDILMWRVGAKGDFQSASEQVGNGSLMTRRLIKPTSPKLQDDIRASIAPATRGGKYQTLFSTPTSPSSPYN